MPFPSSAALGRRRLLPVAATLVALAALVPAASANLLVNGSFEQPVVAPGSYQNFVAGSTAITGWTVLGIDSSVSSGSFVQSGITFNAAEGVQFLDLAGVTSNSKTSGVFQSVATVAGTTYELKFYVGGTSDGQLFFPSTVDLSLNGGARTSFANTASPRNSVDWQLFVVDFVATGASTLLTFYNGSEANNYFSGLDNVSLDAVAVAAPVPEPAEWSLMALGVAALAAYRRRNRRTGRAG